jgi:PAS domain S-box-containing protein
MKDAEKTREQLINELKVLRCRVSELEKAGSASGLLHYFENTVIDGIGDQILVIDADTHNVLLANKAAEEQIGLRDVKDRPVKCFQVSHHRDLPCNEHGEPCPLSHVIETGSPSRVIHKHHDADGNRIYVEIIATPVLDNDNKVVRIIEASRDITERIEIEEEQEQLISDLRNALATIKTLKGLIPVCAWCKKVRDDEGYWESIEDYIRNHSDADFTHGICPSCLEAVEKEHDDKEIK